MRRIPRGQASQQAVVSLVVGFVSVLAPCVASALVISAPGHYIIDSRVDEVLIDDPNLSSSVSIAVVAGGVVEGDIRCIQRSDDCLATVNVSGNGAVLGYIKGADANVTLQDNARVGIAGAGSNTGAAVFVNDNVHLDAYQAASLGANRLLITGGYVGRNIETTEFVQVGISGGEIGSFHNFAGLRFDMSGGRVLEGLSGEGNFEIDAGEVWGGMNFWGTAWGASSISGGSFNANADEYLLRYRGSDALTIDGGLFGNINQGSGFYFSGSGAVDIWGRDLFLTDGLLSGYLLDGSYLSVRTAFSNTRSGSFTIHNVPEPGTLAMFVLGLAGLGFTRRRTLNPATR